MALPAYDLPGPLLAMAQILQGTWLGACVRPDLLNRRRSLLAAVIVCAGLLITVCALGTWGQSRLFGAPFPAVMLGIVPGGVTEMALTAGLRGQDVALVAATGLPASFSSCPVSDGSCG